MAVTHSLTNEHYWFLLCLSKRKSLPTLALLINIYLGSEFHRNTSSKGNIVFVFYKYDYTWVTKLLKYLMQRLRNERLNAR